MSNTTRTTLLLLGMTCASIADVILGWPLITIAYLGVYLWRTYM